MQLEPLFLLAVFVIGLLSGATAAVIGFGIGSLLTPLLVTRLPPNVAIAVVALPHLLASALRYWHHRKNVDRSVLLRFGVGSALGGLAGALLLGALKTPVVLMLLGTLLVATGLMNLVPRLQQWNPGPRLAIVVGVLSGVFGGVAGNQGGLRAAGLSTFGLPPRAYLATSTAVAVLIDVARTPVYIARVYDQLLHLRAPIAVAAIGCLLGTIYGERLFYRIPAVLYRRVVGVAVILLGLWLGITAGRS